MNILIGMALNKKQGILGIMRACVPDMPSGSYLFVHRWLRLGGQLIATCTGFYISGDLIFCTSMLLGHHLSCSRCLQKAGMAFSNKSACMEQLNACRF